MADEDARLFGGIKVLSLAEQYPGPFATLILADLGADVVLVERPGAGDPARVFEGFFESLNRNKRSVALDLKDPEGRRAFRQLAREADVILEGYRPGVARRLEVDYDSIAAIAPQIVYVSISGFGQDGPYRLRPAHDISYQAHAGALWRQAAGEDLPPPTLSTADLSAGMYAALAVASALFSRERTGEGRYIDVAIGDTLLSWMTTQVVPVLNGAGYPGVPHEPGYGLFTTSDGQTLSLSVAHENRFWRALCAATGLDQHAGLASDERLARHDELRDALAGVISRLTMTEWTALLERHDVPFSRVNRLEDLPADPQVRAREMFTELAGEHNRPARVHLRQPLVVDGARPGPERHAPRLGEHTDEVLAALAGRDPSAER